MDNSLMNWAKNCDNRGSKEGAQQVRILKLFVSFSETPSVVGTLDPHIARQFQSVPSIQGLVNSCNMPLNKSCGKLKHSDPGKSEAGSNY